MAKIATKAPAKAKAPAKKPTVKKAVVPAEPKKPTAEKKSADPVVPEQTPEAPAPEQESEHKICVVIPYLHSKADGEELRYALRAWEKHLPGAEIILIGDRPNYVSDLVHHITGLETAGNPQSDVAVKLMQAIASDLVDTDFIFTNDDIYPIAPVDLQRLASPFCAGKLGDKKNASAGYAEKTARTKALLEAEGLSTFDFGTHLPVMYNKEILAELLAKYTADEVGLLISSIYFNTNKEFDPELTKGNATGEHVVYIYRENPNAELIEQAFKKRKFVNHNSAGYLPTLPFLKKKFPEASKFEK